MSSGLTTIVPKPVAVTSRVAVPVKLPRLAVTVCAPAFVELQDAPVHVPFGAMVRTAPSVTSPVLFPKASTLCTEKACATPAGTDALVGVRTRPVGAPGTTVTETGTVNVSTVTVAVCGPATVNVHVVPVHEPLGVTVTTALLV